MHGMQVQHCYISWISWQANGRLSAVMESQERKFALIGGKPRTPSLSLVLLVPLKTLSKSPAAFSRSTRPSFLKRPVPAPVDTACMFNALTRVFCIPAVHFKKCHQKGPYLNLESLSGSFEALIPPVMQFLRQRICKQLSSTEACGTLHIHEVGQGDYLELGWSTEVLPYVFDEL